MVYITRQDDISVLPLSVRSQNCLRRTGIHTVGAMMDYPADQLIKIRNMGKKMIGEIRFYIQALKNGTDEYVLAETYKSVSGKNAVEQETVEIDGSVESFLDETGVVVQDIPVEELQLSVRAKNALIRGGYRYASQLVGISYEKLIKLRNMGSMTAEEVLAYMDKISVTYVPYIKKADGADDYVSVASDEGAADKKRISGSSSATVFFDSNGIVVRDIAINDLRLSARAKTALIRGGYRYASQLVGISYEKLIKLRNMGSMTAEEILACMDKISVVSVPCTDEMEITASGNDLPTAMHVVYGETVSIWMRELLSTKEQFPEAIDETLIYRLYDRPFVRGTVKARILRLLEENNSELSKAALEKKLPQHLNNTTILEEILLELEAISAVEIGEIMIRRQYPSVAEFVKNIEDERIRKVIQGKIEGKTLQEIGEHYGITRERVRQLMQKGLRKKPYLREDKYIYLYEHYDISREDLALAYDEPQETYNYLEMISKITRSKRKPLEEIMTDTAIAAGLRKKAERAIYKQYVSTDGVHLKRARPDLVKHYIRINCKSLTKFDDFVSGYHSWLEFLGLGDDSSFVIEARTYENILNQCDYVLWNQWRSFRYYSIPEHDFEELLSTLNLEQFVNTELSTLKLFREYPDLMQQYDVHDEYELHNLLRKVWPSENNCVKFKRMPTIEIGTADLTNQALDLLLRYAPVSADDLAMHYEEEYGVKAATVRGSYLRKLDHYFYKGVYSVDYAALSSIQFDRMKAVLDCDFYTIQDVKRLYKKEFPNSDESFINPYTLKTLGFHVHPGYSGYIIRNIFLSPTDYFHTILTQSDIVDMRAYDVAIRNIATYGSEQYKLRNDYEIIEFSPLQYINIRRLNEAGVAKEHLNAYCDAVAKYCEKGEYFTITSLRNNGFIHDLDDLGFDEWFYASILLVDRERFSYQRVGGTRVFLRGTTGVNLGDMLVWILERRQKIDLYDLIDLFENHYGVVLRKDKLLSIVDGTELYYDTIMEAVYIDYDTYFEEI